MSMVTWILLFYEQEDKLSVSRKDYVSDRLPLVPNQ